MRYSSPPNQQAYYEQVWNLVRQIPRGKVASYGQIALMIPPPSAWTSTVTKPSVRAGWAAPWQPARMTCRGSV